MDRTEFTTRIKDIRESLHGSFIAISDLQDQVRAPYAERRTGELSAEWKELNAALQALNIALMATERFVSPFDQRSSAFENENDVTEKPWKDADR